MRCPLLVLMLVFTFIESCNAVSFENYEKSTALNDEGYKLVSSDQFKEAIPKFISSWELDKDNERNRYSLRMLYRCYLSIGDFANAKVWIEKFIESFKEDSDPRLVEVYLDFGMILSRLKEYDPAFEKLKKARSITKTNVKVNNNFAWIIAVAPNLKNRDSKLCLAVAEEVLKSSHASEPWFIDTYAAALAENEQFDKAIEWQRKAIEIVGEQKAFDYHLRIRLYEKKIKYRLDMTMDKVLELLQGEVDKL